jgi:5-methylthioribose kinase
MVRFHGHFRNAFVNSNCLFLSADCADLRRFSSADYADIRSSWIFTDYFLRVRNNETNKGRIDQPLEYMVRYCYKNENRIVKCERVITIYFFRCGGLPAIALV